MSIRPLVFSGPSGAGKSTILNELMRRNPGCFSLCVSHTTRKPRPHEVDKVHYYFVDKEEFLHDVDDNMFLEHVEFAGNCYGTSRKAVSDIVGQGKICVLDVEANGVLSIYQADPPLNARFVFIHPSETAELRKRLIQRKTESDDKIEARFQRAQKDINFALEGKGREIYDLYVKNDVLEDAVKRIEEFLADDLRKIKEQMS